MAGGGEYLADTGEISDDGGGTGGQCEFGNEVMLCILASGTKLALQILLRDLHVTQSHSEILVSQQLHDGGQTHVQADHFRGKGMPELVAESEINRIVAMRASPGR